MGTDKDSSSDNDPDKAPINESRQEALNSKFPKDINPDIVLSKPSPRPSKDGENHERDDK